MFRRSRKIARNLDERVQIPEVVLSSVRNRLLFISVLRCRDILGVDLILDVVACVQPLGGNSRLYSRFQASRVGAWVISYLLSGCQTLRSPVIRGACSLPSSVHASRFADRSFHFPAHYSSLHALPLVIP